MKLIELNPSFGENETYPTLDFDCPKCKTHRLYIPIPPHPKAWSKSGETFEDITLSPSILHKCYDADDSSDNGQSGRYCESHFFIRNGTIEMA